VRRPRPRRATGEHDSLWAPLAEHRGLRRPGAVHLSAASMVMLCSFPFCLAVAGTVLVGVPLIGSWSLLALVVLIIAAADLGGICVFWLDARLQRWRP